MVPLGYHWWPLATLWNSLGIILPSLRSRIMTDNRTFAEIMEDIIRDNPPTEEWADWDRAERESDSDDEESE